MNKPASFAETKALLIQLGFDVHVRTGCDLRDEDGAPLADGGVDLWVVEIDADSPFAVIDTFVPDSRTVEAAWMAACDFVTTHADVVDISAQTDVQAVRRLFNLCQ